MRAIAKGNQLHCNEMINEAVNMLQAMSTYRIFTKYFYFECNNLKTNLFSIGIVSPRFIEGASEMLKNS